MITAVYRIFVPVTWADVVREAHRQWARRMAMGGALVHTTRGGGWSEYRVQAWWNRRKPVVYSGDATLRRG
jgi:hypothetical protein